MGANGGIYWLTNDYVLRWYHNGVETIASNVYSYNVYSPTPGRGDVWVSYMVWDPATWYSTWYTMDQTGYKWRTWRW